MSDDLYNDDVVIDTTDILDNSSSVSDISDNSSSVTPPSVTPPTVDPIPVSDDISRVIDGWIKDTSGTGGEPGEVYEDTPPEEKDPLPPPVYKTVTRTIQEIITNYDQEYLQRLAALDGKFYVYYTDGTRDEVDYTEIVNPSIATLQTIVSEVDAVTKANNQHFWYDDNGAHVTDETRDSWEENAAYNFSDLSDSNNHNNLLMNSYGLVIRRALKNLAAFSRSAVTFYDGDGNDVENIMALFGKNGAQIGSINSTKIILDSNQISGVSVDDVSYFNIAITGPKEDIYCAHSAAYYRYTANSNQTILINASTIISFQAGWKLCDGMRIDFVVEDGPPLDKCSVYYGVSIDTWQDWEYGQYKYNGNDILELKVTKDIVKAKLLVCKEVNTPLFTFGNGTASASYAVSEGQQTVASGKQSHAEGYQTQATAPEAHAEGMSSYARGTASHAEGYLSEANGDIAHAEGLNTLASADGTHAEGCHTKATKEYAHAEGEDTIASGRQAHAEGDGTTSSAWAAHAEGSSTTASGDHSHAEGNLTTASGSQSHAEGYETIASGDHSHAQNLGTLASSDNQTVIGKYNIEDTADTYAFIIGNGTGYGARSNAFTVDWNGAIDFGPQAISRNTNATLVMQNRSTQLDYGGLYICDKNADSTNFVVRQHIRETPNNGVRWYRTEISRTVNNNRAYNTISIGLDASNNAIYGVSNPSAFRAAINAVDAGRFEIVEYADPRFIIYGASGTAIEFVYNPTSKNLAVRGFDGSSWTNYKAIVNLA